MSDVARLVETLFGLRGYQTDPVPAGHVLRFHRERDAVAVRVRETREVLPASTATEVADTLPAFGHAILVCFGDVGHEARAALERGGVDVWTRDKLIHELGKACLEAAERSELPEAFGPPRDRTLEILETLPHVETSSLPPAPSQPPQPPVAVPAPAAEPPLPPIAPTIAELPTPPLPPPPLRAPSIWTRTAEPTPVAAPLPPGPSPTVVVAALPLTPGLVQVASPAPTSSALLPALPTLAQLNGGPAAVAPMASAAPAPTVPSLFAPPPPLAPAIAPAPPVPTLATAAAPASRPSAGPAEPGVLAASVDRDTATKTGLGRLLRVDKATLELRPLHAFRYACSLAAKGVTSIPKHGLLAVDAVTGGAREIPEPTFGALPEPGRRVQALVAELDAVTHAKRKVVELHTQKMRVSSGLGRNALIVEDKVVRPDPHTMQMDHQGLWWHPVWRLEGQNGSLVVDATTGDIAEEKLKKNFAEDAEFL